LAIGMLPAAVSSRPFRKCSDRPGHHYGWNHHGYQYTASRAFIQDAAVQDSVGWVKHFAFCMFSAKHLSVAAFAFHIASYASDSGRLEDVRQ
jgi:hypothetical protein